MPGEEGFISALTAPVVNLAIAAVVIALIAVVLMALLFLISNRQSSSNLARSMESHNRTLGALVAQGNQLVTQGHQLENMVRAIERGQDIQRDQTSAMLVIRETLTTHEDHSIERSQTLLERFDTVTESITNLIGDTGQKVAAETGRIVGESTGKVMDAIKPLIDSLLEIKASIEDAKDQSRQQQEQQAQKSRQAFDVIEAKIGLVGEQVIDVIQVMQGEMRSENTKQLGDGGAGAAGVGVSSGAAIGSAGDSRTDKPDGANGTADGSAA